MPGFRKMKEKFSHVKCVNRILPEYKGLKLDAFWMSVQVQPHFPNVSVFETYIMVTLKQQ